MRADDNRSTLDVLDSLISEEPEHSSNAAKKVSARSEGFQR